MLRGFKEFIMRGNVVDLAIAVVIGAAFGAVVNALVKDIVTPIIAAIGGQPDFSKLTFTVNKSTFLYGEFINAIVAFVLIAAAIYFVVVLPLNKVAARRALKTAKGEPAPHRRPRTSCCSNRSATCCPTAGHRRPVSTTRPAPDRAEPGGAAPSLVMRRPLSAVPVLVAAGGLVAPADVAFVAGHARQHRLVTVGARLRRRLPGVACVSTHALSVPAAGARCFDASEPRHGG